MNCNSVELLDCHFISSVIVVMVLLCGYFCLFVSLFFCFSELRNTYMRNIAFKIMFFNAGKEIKVHKCSAEIPKLGRNASLMIFNIFR